MTYYFSYKSYWQKFKSSKYAIFQISNTAIYSIFTNYETDNIKERKIMRNKMIIIIVIIIVIVIAIIIIIITKIIIIIIIVKLIMIVIAIVR